MMTKSSGPLQVFRHFGRGMEALKGGSAVKLTTDENYGLAIGDAVADGDTFKVKINKMKSFIYLGLLGTTSTIKQHGATTPSSYNWQIGLGSLVKITAGNIQGSVSGSVKTGDVVLFKRVGGELRMKLADGTVHRMPVPKGQALYVFTNLVWSNDEVELLPVSPAEAASL